MRNLFTIFVIIAVIFIAPFAPVHAESLSPGQKVVAVFPVINNSGIKGGSYVESMVEDKLGEKFANGKYNVLSGQALMDGLRREGIDDFRTADSTMLIAALQRMRVDYSVRMEVQYVYSDQRMRFPDALFLVKIWTATVPLYANITDINRGVAIYDSVIVETGVQKSMVGFVHLYQAAMNALGKDLDRFDREAAIPE
jgi:hypothetical protein